MKAAEIEDVFALAAAPPLATAVDHFYFLRHGQTAGNAARIFQTATIELNETGIRQARAAAEKLKAVRFREIFCSHWRRAHDTALIVAEVTGKPLTVLPELHERFFGDLIGTSAVNLDWAADPPGGETLREFIERTKRGLETALKVSGDPPLIVAHGGTLRVVVAALGAAVYEAARENATPLEFKREQEGWRLTLL